MKSQRIKKGLILGLLPVIAILISLASGRFSVFQSGVKNLFNGQTDALAYNVFWTVRLPRTVAAFLVGGILAMSGNVLQGVFRNPLVSPDIIGISWGASLGAAIAIVLLDASLYVIQAMSFVGGVLAVLLVFYISSASQNRSVTNIVIAGLLVNSLSQAGVTLLKYMSDYDNKLPALEYWLMGSFNKVKPVHLALIVPVAVVGLILLVLLRWQINILSLGDEDATYLGAPVARTRVLIVGVVTFCVAASVSVSGVIGWVGLIAPHIIRLLFGNNYDRTVPLSFAMGGTLLVLADTLARSMLTKEIPISVVTAFVGAPIFGYLLLKVGGRSWESS